MEQEKTPWRKNLDTRYVSGEDLLTEQKGLKKEMVVTLSKWEDSPAFDQKLQKEVDKTAVWLKEYPSCKPLYKPALLNVTNGDFLSKEIGNGSLYIDDFDQTKPFIIYAMPDKRHGHVARFKKYYPPVTISPDAAITALSKATSLAELGEAWTKLTDEEKKLPTVLSHKDALKTKLTPA